MGHHIIRGALFTSTVVCIAAASPAVAQQKRFNVPPQAAATGIPEFARQADIQILVSEAAVRNKNTKSVHGTLQIQEALRRLLNGTGLHASSEDGQTFTLSAEGNGAAAESAASKGEAAAGRAAAENGNADQQEIVVTAQKRSERLRDTPQSVSVLTAENLAKVGATQFRDFADTVPGLSYQSSGAGQTQIFLRGVTAGVDTSPTVGIVIDDVPIGSSSAFVRSDFLALDVGLFDIDRIEVLRGPQGTLYGASTMGGLIKYVSKSPDADAFGVDAQGGLSATNDGGISYNAAAAVNTPLVSERAALRVGAFYSHDGGYVDNLKENDPNANRSNVYGLRGDLLFKPSDRLTVKIGGFTQNIDRHGTAAVDYDRLTGKPLYGSLKQRHIPEPFKSRFRLVDGVIDYEFGAAKLTSISSYQFIQSRYEVDYSAQFVPLLSDFGLGDFSGVGIVNVQGSKKFTQEVRLASNGAHRLEWLIGGFYTNERSRNDVALDPRDLITGNPAPNDLITVATPTTYRELAGFANATFHLTDRLDLSGGLRYAHNKQHYTDIESGILAGPVLPPAESSDSTVTYLANARYRFSDRAMGYVRFATAYRPGGPNGVATDPFTGLPLAPPTFDPDHLYSYEAGFKGETPDRRFAIDASAYYIDWKNIQVFATRNGFGGIANAAGATVKGAELTLTARPAPGVTLTSAFAYQNPQLTDDAPDIGGSKGDRLPNVPHFTAALNADVELSRKGVRPWVGGGFHYISSRLTSFDNSTSVPQYRLPSYATVDLRAGITTKFARLNFFARNLFDKRGQVIAPTLASTTDAMQVIIIQPRTIGVEATSHF